jgi:hypothetical protein
MTVITGSILTTVNLAPPATAKQNILTRFQYSVDSVASVFCFVVANGWRVLKVAVKYAIMRPQK